MEFEFNEQKSQSNKDKHGIDFVEAQTLWEDTELLEVPLKSEDEPRVLYIGRIGDRHWSAIVTHRQGRVRIISVRRSRNSERAIYES